MEYERISKTSSFTFGGASIVQEPPRTIKNAYASQYQKNHLYPMSENYYQSYSNNNIYAGSARFHQPKTTAINYNSNSGSSNAITSINSNPCHFNSNYLHQRYTPYNKRPHANAPMPQQRGYQSYLAHQQYQSQDTEYVNSLALANGFQSLSAASYDTNNNQSLPLLPSSNVGIGTMLAPSTKNSALLSTIGNTSPQDMSCNGQDSSSCVTLQISNLDSTYDEHALKQQLINKLKPITSVISIYFEAISVAKIKLPSAHHAKQVISYLHRKKIGHKRITVSYIRESSSMEPSTLRCQVVGILKDIPDYKLSMFKFREIFQSRFKTSISVIDLYEMKDICTIIENNKEEKYITLRAELVSSIENSDLIECLQHSVPYCTNHFVKSHRGWAEQEIDPLPNVVMSIPQIRTLIYSLLRSHKGDIPIASIIHCIQAELRISLDRNEAGVNFEHLITCVSGIQITSNKFGIKILSWLNPETACKDQYSDEPFVPATTSTRYSKYGNIPDSFNQVSREIVELIKMSPKSTLKFSRFIPAYHNHFGKQCRVADYGYTKLIDLFEALSTVVQVMGEGENRQITLTHKMQVRRFTSDLLRVLRTQSTKSIQLSQLAMVFEQVQARKFDITDYGVCDVKDILDGLINSNVVVVSTLPHSMDIMISIPKRKQSTIEVEKTSIFAGEVVELLKHASQYTILFEKFACSYHYHFGYQCRLCDYGFVKLADLMEAITGLVEMEFSNDEDRKISLSPKIARRIFSEQLKMLTEMNCGTGDNIINLPEVLVFHKKNFGYQISPQTLGFDDIMTCLKALPYIEIVTTNGYYYIKCNHDDQEFRQRSYAACRLLRETNEKMVPMAEFTKQFAEKFNYMLSERMIESMKHAIEIQFVNNVKYVTITKMMEFIIHVISVVESHGVMKIQDLQNVLNLPINGCFSFGYPNLWSMLQAFPDIFVSTSAKPINFRGEFKLNPQCILTTAGFVAFMQYSCDENNNASLGQEDSIEVLDSTHNNSSGYSGSRSSVLSLSNASDKSAYIDPMDLRQTYENSNSYSRAQNRTIAELDSSQSARKDSSKHQSEMFSDEVSSVPITNGDHTLVKSEEGPMHRIFDGKDHTNSRKRLMNTFYSPPKPDTPPSSSQSKKLPFWLDPIWGLEYNSPQLNTLNVKIPDLKLLNQLPKLSTPVAMASLARKSKFSFDSNTNNQENVI